MIWTFSSLLRSFSCYLSAHPDPLEGRLANRRERWIRLRWTLSVSQASDARCGRRNRVVLIPRPDPTLGSSLPEVIRQVMEAIKPGTPGRARISRKPLRRECSGGKTSIKSILRAACMLRCVAICCSQYFSTTLLAEARPCALRSPRVW